MERPDTWVGLIIWVLCLPVYIPLYYTLSGPQMLSDGCPMATICILRPWPSKGSKFYMVSFGLSLMWIGGFAFCLVWWTEIVPKLQLKTLFDTFSDVSITFHFRERVARFFTTLGTKRLAC